MKAKKAKPKKSHSDFRSVQKDEKKSDFSEGNEALTLEQVIPLGAKNRDSLVDDCYRLLDVYPYLTLGGKKPLRAWCMRPVTLGGAGWSKARTMRVLMYVNKYLAAKDPNDLGDDEQLQAVLHTVIRQAAGTQQGFKGKSRADVVLRATELLARMGGFDKGQKAKSQMHDLEDTLAMYEGTGAGRSVSNPRAENTIVDTEVLDALEP